MANSIFAAIGDALLIIESEGSDGQIRDAEYNSPLCVEHDPTNPDIVYCGTAGSGVWRSIDGGESWEQASDGLDHDTITAIAVDPHPRDGSQIVWAGADLSAMYRSEDAGESWEKQTEFNDLDSKPDWFYPPRPDTHHVRWITPDPNNRDQLYVSIESGGIVSSPDGGETWFDRVPGGPFDVHSLAMHPEEENRIYAAAGDGINRVGHGFWESYDGGQNWSCPTDGITHHYSWGLAIDPTNPNSIMMSAAHCPTDMHESNISNSFVYHYDGGAWQRCDSDLPETTDPILEVNEKEPGVFYVLTSKGIYRTENEGQDWESLGLKWGEYSGVEAGPFNRRPQARPTAIEVSPNQ